MILHVAYQPREVLEPERRVCLVVDVLRATSTLVALLEAGCQDVQLEPTVADARAAAGSDRLLCGEEGGIRPAGFHYGNSPAEYSGLDLRGRSVTFATTNGTKALQLALRSPLVLAGCMLNGPAAAALAVREAEARGLDLQVVCAGRMNGTVFALDDAFCAGYLVGLLVDYGPFAVRQGSDSAPVSPGDQLPPATAPQPGSPASAHYLHDSAVAALRLFRSYRAEHPTLEAAALAAFHDSASGRGLIGLGLGADLAYCARPGISTVVPRAAPDAQAPSRIRVVEAKG